MISQSQDSSPPHGPWAAIVGELVTAACFGLLALFLPFGYWVTWPELLRSWHFAVAIAGTLVLAVALFRRRPQALKAAVALGAYVGVPSLLNLWQALGEIHATAGNPAVTLIYAAWGFGMLGQVAVVWSCLRRLAPVQPRRPAAAARLDVQPRD